MTSTGSTNSLSAASQPITLTEQGPNSGVFGTYDESDTSIVQVASNAQEANLQQSITMRLQQQF